MRHARRSITHDDAAVTVEYRFSEFVKRGDFNPETLLWLSSGPGGAGYFVTDTRGMSIMGNERRVTLAKVERALAGK